MKNKITIVFVLFGILVFSSPVLAIMVGVVTTFPDGTVRTDCVNVAEGATAKDALKATLMRTEWKSYPFGDALTRIEGVGCPESNPFCECEKPAECCLFWNFWIIKSGEKEWQYPTVGYSNYVVGEGDVIGSIWTDDTTKAPKLVRFSQLERLCPKTRTYAGSPKYYEMYTCALPTVEVLSPKPGDILENKYVTVEAIGGHKMKKITVIINDFRKTFCRDCMVAVKEIIAKIGNNKLQVQVEDYIGRKVISNLIEFLVS